MKKVFEKTFVDPFDKKTAKRARLQRKIAKAAALNPEKKDATLARSRKHHLTIRHGEGGVLRKVIAVAAIVQSCVLIFVRVLGVFFTFIFVLVLAAGSRRRRRR